MTKRIGAAAIALAMLASACSSSSESATACDAVPTSIAAELLGSDVVAEPFQLDQLDECVWRSPENPESEMVLRVEVVPEPETFVEHSIEATTPERVRTLELGDQAVLFEDEALLARLDDRVFLVTGTPAMNDLIPVLESAVDAFAN